MPLAVTMARWSSRTGARCRSASRRPDDVDGGRRWAAAGLVAAGRLAGGRDGPGRAVTGMVRRCPTRRYEGFAMPFAATMAAMVVP